MGGEAGEGETYPLDAPDCVPASNRKLSLAAPRTHPFVLRPGRLPRQTQQHESRTRGREWNAGRTGGAGPRAPGHPSGAGARGAGRMLRGRTHLLQPARAPLAASGARDAHPAAGAGARGRARPGAGSRGAPARGLCSAARGNRGAKASPPFSPNPLQTASPVPGPGATRARAAAAPGRGGRRVVTEARSSSPARGLAPARVTPRDARREPGEPRGPGPLGGAVTDYSYSRGRRARPDCGLGLPQSGSLKGPRQLGLRLRLRLRLPLRPVAAATCGQSGRGPEAGCRADLQVLGLGSRKGLRNGNTQGGLRWDPGRTHLARDRECGSSSSQSREQNYQVREPSEPASAAVST